MKKIKTAKGRKPSSTRWIERQLTDPYVAKARELGYRSRAAFKLLEIDEKHKILKPGMAVVDLGAAPGGWCQVAIQKKCSPVVAIDLLGMDEIPGVSFLQLDFMDEDAPLRLRTALGKKADVVLSDMAHNTTGHRETDHLKIMGLVEAAYEFAAFILNPGGSFVAKVFQGGTESSLLDRIKKDFETTRHVKPPASRQESAEVYLLATGFRGAMEHPLPLPTLPDQR